MKRIAYIRNTKSKHLLRIGISDSEELCRNRAEADVGGYGASGEVRDTVGQRVKGSAEDYTVSLIVYSSLSHPAVGDLVDEYMLEEIVYSDEQYRAERKALSLLALADNNERTLIRKLITFGIRREIAEEVTHKMVSLGYINEAAQLERLIMSEARAYRGPVKILSRLVGRGYSSADVKRTMHALCESGEIDFSALARELITKKLPKNADAEEKKRLLYKHGYKIC